MGSVVSGGQQAVAQAALFRPEKVPTFNAVHGHFKSHAQSPR
jgi:hypothetical protein